VEEEKNFAEIIEDAKLNFMHRRKWETEQKFFLPDSCLCSLICDENYNNEGEE
jgi:hypothetical protein